MLIETVTVIVRASLLLLVVAAIIRNYMFAAVVARWLISLAYAPISFTLTFRFDVLHVGVVVFILMGIVYHVVNKYWWKAYSRLEPRPSQRASINPSQDIFPSAQQLEHQEREEKRAAGKGKEKGERKKEPKHAVINGTESLYPFESKTEINSGSSASISIETILKTMRIFGYLDEDVLQILLDHSIRCSLGEGECIDLSENDDFYVVLKGKVRLMVPSLGEGGGEILKKAFETLENAPSSTDGFEKDPASYANKKADCVLSEVGPGGSCSSLFALLSTFTQTKPVPLKVKGIATVQSQLLKIPKKAFECILEDHPTLAAHITQVIMTRFQKVTFMTLGKYLGLGKEAMDIERGLLNGRMGNKKTENAMHKLKFPSFAHLFPSIAHKKSGGKDGVDDDGSEIGGYGDVANKISHLNAASKQAAQQKILKYFGSLFDISLSPHKGRGESGEQDLCSSIQFQTISCIDQKIIRMGEKSKGLYILIRGTLQFCNESSEDDNNVLDSISKEGSIIGSMSAFLGHQNMITIKTSSPCILAHIPKPLLETIVEYHPKVLLRLAGGLLTRLSPLLRAIDLALQWLPLSAGQVLCRQGDACTHIYLVLHGRLRYLHQRTERKQAANGHQKPTDLEDAGIGSEYGAGDSLGECEVMVGGVWPGNLHAIRDSEVACMPRILFDALAQLHPQITINICKMIALKSMRQQQAFSNTNNSNNFHNFNAAPSTSIATPEHTNILNVNSGASSSSRVGRTNGTVAIIPIHPQFHSHATNLAQQLRDRLQEMTPNEALLLDSHASDSVMGRHAFSAFGRLKVMNWIHKLEEEHSIIIYLADPLPQSKWTATCMKQADCIYMVADAGSQAVEVGAFERRLLASGCLARREIVLCHRSLWCASGLVRRWLDGRPWVTEHHHVHLTPLQQNKSINIANNKSAKTPSKGARDDETKTKINNANTVISTFIDHLDGIVDIAAASAAITSFWTQHRHRLQSSLSHIPQSASSSTSAAINAARSLLNHSNDAMDGHRRMHLQQSLAALMARLSCDDVARLARRLLGKSVGLILGGGGARGIAHLGCIQALTEAGIPIDMIGGTSIGSFVGALYARDIDVWTAKGFAKIFSARMSSVWRQLLDLTYPVTSWFTGHAFNRSLWKIFGDRQIEDLWIPYYCISTDLVHSRQVVHKSGYVWRFVRASMSLCGFLPPLCEEDSLLVDGGYLNNVPADVMMDTGQCKHLIAIDVGAEDDWQCTNYGDSLNGFWIMIQRIIGRPVHIPTLTDIQSRLAFVGCVEKLASLRTQASLQSSNIIYLRPPIQAFGVMDFAKFDAIFEIGLKYGCEVVSGWRRDGTIGKLLGFEKARVLSIDDSRKGYEPVSDKESKEAPFAILPQSKSTPHHSHHRRRSV